MIWPVRSAVNALSLLLRVKSALAAQHTQGNMKSQRRAASGVPIARVMLSMRSAVARVSVAMPNGSGSSVRSCV
jgi:hypothetical protein